MGLFDFLGGGDNDSTTTNTQTSTPWKPVTPYYKDIFGQAAYQYDAATPQNQVWQGPRYIDPTRMEVNAMEGLAKTAGENSGLINPALSQWQEQLRSGGLAGMGAALNPLRDIARGDIRLQTGDQYRDVYRGFGGDPVAEQNLMDTARGLRIGQNNEHMMAALDRAAERAGHAVGSAMSGAGRYGSGVHQGVLAREVGDIYSRGLAESTERDLQRQMAAAGQIDQSRLGYGGQQLAALGGLTGVQGANIANRAGAAGQYGDTMFRGADTAMRYGLSAPAIDQMRYDPYERQLQLGAAQRGELQQELAANQGYFNEMRDAPYNALSRYSSLIYGSPAGQFNTQTSTVPQVSPLLGALGGGLAGAQLGGMFGMPMLGAGAGALMGLFG